MDIEKNNLMNMKIMIGGDDIICQLLFQNGYIALYAAIKPILKTAKTEQHKNRFLYGELYSLNYYLEVKEKDRTYYEVYSLPRSEEVPEGYKELSFVCLRPDGAFEAPSTVGIMCRTARKKVEGLEDFHFHMLRHTYTSNLLSNGAAPSRTR